MTDPNPLLPLLTSSGGGALFGHDGLMLSGDLVRERCIGLMQWPVVQTLDWSPDLDGPTVEPIEGTAVLTIRDGEHLHSAVYEGVLDHEDSSEPYWRERDFNPEHDLAYAALVANRPGWGLYLMLDETPSVAVFRTDLHAERPGRALRPEHFLPMSPSFSFSKPDDLALAVACAAILAADAAKEAS